MKNIAKKVFISTWSNTLHTLNKFSPETATIVMHYMKTGRVINLKNPTKFNDKLHWLRLNYHNPLTSICADKYGIYSYVEQKGEAQLLNNLIAVYDSVDEIDWNALPDKFAMKCTHGSGYNIVTTDKSQLDKSEVLLKLNAWMNEEFGKKNLEWHYDNIKPRIIVEEYIETDAGFFPKDYKIYCFNGVPKVVLVCSDRGKDIKYDYFDLDWNRLEIGFKKDQSEHSVEKPSCLDEMLKYAADLSQPFPYVRVDFYDKDGTPILGEMTFTPAANMGVQYNDYGLKYLGSLLELPDKNK